MANAPNTPNYLLVSPDTTDLPNSRTLAANNGIALLDTGVGGTLTIAPTGNLSTLQAFDTSGYMVYNSTSNTIAGASLSGSTSINITNPSGVGGSSTFSVNPNTTVQQVNIENNSVQASTRPTLNLIPGAGINISVNDNGVANRADITLSAAGVSPTGNETFILQTPSSLFPSSQALNALSTGILKSTTTTGVVSTAVAGTDYLAPSANLNSIASASNSAGNLLVGSGTGFSALSIGPANTVMTSNGSNVGWTNYTPPSPLYYIADCGVIPSFDPNGLRAVASGFINSDSCILVQPSSATTANASFFTVATATAFQGFSIQQYGAPAGFEYRYLVINANASFPGVPSGFFTAMGPAGGAPINSPTTQIINNNIYLQNYNFVTLAPPLTGFNGYTPTVFGSGDKNFSVNITASLHMYWGSVFPFQAIPPSVIPIYAMGNAVYPEQVTVTNRWVSVPGLTSTMQILLTPGLSQWQLGVVSTITDTPGGTGNGFFINGYTSAVSVYWAVIGS